MEKSLKSEPHSEPHDFTHVDISTQKARKPRRKRKVVKKEVSEDEEIIRFNSKNTIRIEKIKKYWNKKKRRNFNRDISYPTRKRVAELRPRVNGMFISSKKAKILFDHDGIPCKPKNKKPKKRPGRKRKYDVIKGYSEIDDLIQSGMKIFKITHFK